MHVITTRRLAAITATALLATGLTAPANADDDWAITGPAGNTPTVTADADTTTGTTQDITQVGTLQITNLTNEKGEKLNGVMPDGTTITDGKNADPTGQQLIFTFQGHINDMAALKEGDKVAVTTKNASNENHFGIPTGAWSGPTVIRNANGDILFNVTWGQYPSAFTLTRTGTAANGSFDFTVSTTPFQNWWDTRTPNIDSTTTSWTIGGQTITFNNDPVPAERKQPVACTADGGLQLQQMSNSSDKVNLMNSYQFCTDLNNLLKGQPTGAITEDIVRFIHLAPTKGKWSGRISFNGWSAVWNPLYDDTTLNSNNTFATYYALQSIVKKSTETVGSLDEARAKLKVNEYAYRMNADGSLDLAINMGPRQGNTAILATGMKVSDAKTQTAIDKANAAKLGPQILRHDFNFFVSDPSQPFQATVTTTDYVGGKTLTNSFNVSNSLGSAAGQGQSTVRLDANGGTGAMADSYGDPGRTMKLPKSTFTRDGYVFDGWNSKKDGSGVKLPDEGEVTFDKEGAVQVWYAQWKASKSTVTYDKNAKDATGDTPATDGVTDGTVKTAANGFAYTGYTFDSWNTKADGSGDKYGENADVKLPAGGLTLYAQWVPGPSQVRYHANGGTGSIPDTEGVTGQQAKIEKNTFIRIGYSFTGWNTKADGSGDKVAEESMQPLPNTGLDLYAQWEAGQAGVSYVSGATDATGDMPDTEGKTGDTVTIAENKFTRPGYTFTGWMTPDGKTVQPGDKVTLEAGGLVLTAQWDAQPATLHYDGNGGTGSMSDQTGKTGDTVTTAENTFVKPGYVFAGWKAPDGATVPANGKVTLPAGGLTLSAQWTPISYKVKYDANQGAGSMADQSFTYDAEQALTGNTLTRTGYSFAGWNTKADGSGDKYTDGQKVSNLTDKADGEITLYAQWIPITYVVEYHAGDHGTGTMPDQTLTYDKAERLTVNGFTRDGYTFAGWRTPDGKTLDDQAEILNLTDQKDAHVTLTAQWTAAKASVRYHANGGQGTMPDTDGVTDQSVTVAASLFTRQGYRFTGWNTKADGTGTKVTERTQLKLPADGVDLYAQWEALDASVRYDPNGGTGSMDPTKGVTDQTVTIEANRYVKTGYRFTGWKTADGTTYQAGQTVTLTAQGLTLIAQWTPITYTVHYAANGGTGSMTDQPLTYDQPAQLAKNGFTRDGYTFTGWLGSDGKSYTDAQQVTNLTSKDGDVITLTAQWAGADTVLSYDGNGADGAMADINGHVGDVITLPQPTFTRQGYRFTGWNTSADNTGTPLQAGDQYELTAEHVTLYAQWEAQPAILSYDGNGGTGSVPSQTGVTNSQLTVGGNAYTRDGYRFTGWNTKPDGTGEPYHEGDPLTLPAGNITLYAQWKAMEATLRYDGNGGTGGIPPYTGATGDRVKVADNTFTRPGFAFTLWLGSDGNPYRPGDTITLPAGGLTLSAQWSADVITITYDPNGGQGVMPPQTLPAGTPTLLTANTYYRDGYTFTGWNTAKDGTGTAYDYAATVTLTANTTLYAQWTTNSEGAGNGDGTGTGTEDGNGDNHENTGNGNGTNTGNGENGNNNGKHLAQTGATMPFAWLTLIPLTLTGWITSRRRHDNEK